MPDGNEPIDEDELIYRRVPNNGYYEPGRLPFELSDKAFKPIRDVDGISVTRSRYGATPEAVAADGFAGREYYVIEMRAGDMMSVGVEIRPAPLEHNLGHAVVPQINLAEAKLPMVLHYMDALRKRPYRAHGPFPGTNP